MSQVQSADCQQFTTVAITTNAETLIGVSIPAAVESSTVKVSVKGFVTITPGTGTTAITLRLYRGAAVGGPLIGVAAALAGMFTVGAPTVLSVFATDALNNAAQAQYALTATQTAGSANGTVNIAVLETMVLSG